MNHSGFIAVAKRLAQGSECECVACGLFFTSERAFGRHQGPDGCYDPRQLTKVESDEPVFVLQERSRGETWGLA